jgi:hypothetical protein
LATVVISASALVCIGASALLSSPPADGTTALPAGWELCILQGMSAPATQANVSDLDEWQLAEGGSTNNSNAYNPFNTRRTTDANNAPLPETMTSNGFPAFANWLAGCSATTATLFQPNMWSITAALRAGDVAPPQAFLATVDQSQWCAPSNGTPCYESAILGVAGTIATAVLTGSSALAVYGNVQNDVHAYQLSVLTVSGDQNALAARNQDLAAALSVDGATHSALASADQALQHFAVDEYVSSGLYVSTSIPTGQGPSNPFGPQNADGVVAHQYESIAAGDLVTRDQVALTAYHAARNHVHDTSKAVAAAMSKLAWDDAAQTRSLSKLVADVATMQTAGACTAIALTTAPLGTPAPGQDSSTTATTATAAPPTTTTTTTPPAASAAPTTTTTLLAPAPAVDPTPTVPSTTTTIASPTSTTTTTTTTTTTVPPTTTTTTTTPAAPAGGIGTGTATAPAPPATADPAGFSALQGCVAALAPPAPPAPPAT